jgi:acetyl-CoA synthetase
MTLTRTDSGTQDETIYMRFTDSYKKHPELFWETVAKEQVDWFAPFTKVTSGEFKDGLSQWFLDGKLNVSYNCIDRHMKTNPHKIAMIWERDEMSKEAHHITYQELGEKVSKIANVLKSQGVKKGDVVTIYMPMVPELPMTMLACARIGAVHSIVFAGFSAEALQSRLEDCNSRFLIIQDKGIRGGKITPLLDITQKTLQAMNIKPLLLLWGNVQEDPHYIAMECALKTVESTCPCEWMDSEDPLFILYTSGSTGKPKGVVHSTGGYLVNAAFTTKNSFDVQEDDVFCCVADCGWITGHTYIVYGPLCLGTTTVLFESVPTYPNPYRYWDLVQKHQVTQFYTAPTAIRALMRYDTEPIKEYDLSSLRILGSVGEPINPEAWKWYYEHVGREKCALVDTYWQTETGAHLATNLPNIMKMKPGSCALPCYGIDFAILDPVSGKELDGPNVEGVLCIKGAWPSMARTIYGDHERFLATYMHIYPGYYFTGDGCKRDEDGYYFITGRVDDVINPSGHRIGTAEVESALVVCEEVIEAAVVGFPHEVKGEGICCFVVLGSQYTSNDTLTKSLKLAVRNAIGPFATPDRIIYTDLPKTRSGKIMRRILRKIATGEEDAIGDVSTLADPSIVPHIIELYKSI